MISITCPGDRRRPSGEEGRGPDEGTVRLRGHAQGVQVRTGLSSSDARLVIDRFHLSEPSDAAVDDARKRTDRKLKKAEKYHPKRVGYTVLYRRSDRDEKHGARMDDIRLDNPELATTFDFKEEYPEAFKA